MSDYQVDADLPLFASNQDASESGDDATDMASDNRRRQQIVLDAIRREPLSFYQAERIVHRGQAVVRELRQQGFVFESDMKARCYRFVSGPDELLVKVRDTVQSSYYQTPHWKAIAQHRKKMDQFQCCQCSRRSNLHTHHWAYNLFAEDIVNDLITLCEICHETVHSLTSGSSIHFPVYLPQEMIDRILSESGRKDFA